MDLETALAQLRRDGWRVAVHNDYRQDGEDFTFWLFTHDAGLFVKGEGRTDRDAIAAVCEQARRVFAPSP